MIGDEFDDLMPHRIRVRSAATKNDYGRPILDPESERVYRCLLDGSEVTSRSADGTSVSVNLTAHVRAVPIDHEVPWEIRDTDEVTIIDPVDWPRPVRPLVSVATHYDADGTAHNMTLRFS